MARITFESVLKMAASLPGIEGRTSARGSSLKSGGTMLACTAIHKSAEPNSMVLRIDHDQREGFIADAPEVFYITQHYQNYPCVLVRLSRVTPDVLRDVLLAAQKFVSAGARKRPPSRR